MQARMFTVVDNFSTKSIEKRPCVPNTSKILIFPRYKV